MKLFKRILRWAAILLFLIVLGLVIWIGPITYRAIHGVNVYETVPPRLPDDLRSPAILIFSKTNGFRHEGAIEGANTMFREVARERGWGIYETENGAVFNPQQLARFRVVVFSNASGNMLTPLQWQAFKTYLISGGGFVGIHAAGDGSQRLPWYVDQVIGAQFANHIGWPGIAAATVRIENAADPVTSGLPGEWKRADEWYSFHKSVRDKGYQVLATVDETTYKPRDILMRDIAMGKDHPVVWSHCVGRGRVLYTAMGHEAAAFAEPHYRALLTNAVAWAASEAPCVEGK
ncbi:ThuA domain-containing protein [Novosphingobium sp. G106]|uniref:ThuA domain-containing protein n=1 Tax=Novosphingobium sp. G106 TaxID=2849500 RepID=UPI001C2D31D5|nr:ThuA domain-containing protein [Novosphingobium sp. G106]MBV1687829.1 ThuA domain-containing protein [Novosphingobium sp. G106]